MLTNEVRKKIEDFVYSKPRSVQEIAKHLDKNWRTVDRYIEEIIKEHGTLDRRIFREGTRGALKIIYWASIEKASSSVFQVEMEKRIYEGKKRWDFPAFDIFQHVPDRDKKVWMKTAENEIVAGRLKEFAEFLMQAEKQVLFFSGNLSFINFEDGETNIFEVLDNLVEKGISIKVLCRVDVVGRENIEKLLSLNFKYGKELVEINHREQPLRATIVDGKMINLKEVKIPDDCGEIRGKTIIIYTIKNKDWSEWLSKIFWKMFSHAIGSKKRLKEIEKLG